MPNASGRIEILLCWLHRHGIRTLPFPAVFRGDAVYLPPARGTYVDTRLARRTRDADTGVERWWVESPAMRREVQVQVLRIGNPNVPAPLLLLLDGSSAPTNNGWLNGGRITETLRNDNVVVVMPTEASGCTTLTGSAKTQRSDTCAGKRFSPPNSPNFWIIEQMA